jgi:hypothetical protein
MFTSDYTLERALQQCAAKPELKKTYSPAFQKRLDEYAELKTQNELPPEERPLRRALMSPAEKAAFLAKHSVEAYEKLPY